MQTQPGQDEVMAPGTGQQLSTGEQIIQELRLVTHELRAMREQLQRIALQGAVAGAVEFDMTAKKEITPRVKVTVADLPHMDALMDTGKRLYAAAVVFAADPVAQAEVQDAVRRAAANPAGGDEFDSGGPSWGR